MTSMAIGHGPFIDGLPINSMVIFHGYVSHNQMVSDMYGQKLDIYIRRHMEIVGNIFLHVWKYMEK